MKFTIEGRIPSKKNSKRIVMFGKRPAIITSKDYQVWHEATMYVLKLQMPKKLILRPPHKVEITIFAPNMVKSDLTNKAESIMDLMVDMGIIEDDNWFLVTELTLRFGGLDREFPRAEIKVEQNKIEKENYEKEKTDGRADRKDPRSVKERKESA